MANKRRKGYSDLDLEDAVRAVKSGEFSVRKAAEEFGVPRQTILDHVHDDDISKHIGRPTILSDKEEALLLDYINVMAQWGFPFSALDLRIFVKSYLDKKGATTYFKGWHDVLSMLV